MNNFIVTSGGVILDEQDKILLNKDPYRGWELPDGVVPRWNNHCLSTVHY